MLFDKHLGKLKGNMCMKLKVISLHQLKIQDGCVFACGLTVMDFS